MCYAVLPDGDGVLSMWSHHRTAPELRPAGANTTFRMIEPFRRWHVSFDGYGLHTSTRGHDLRTRPGGHRSGGSSSISTSSSSRRCGTCTPRRRRPPARGRCTSQGWAKEHYEQLYHATGTVQFGDLEVPFDGYGWRDHSQGPRGGDTGAPWGGHVITGCVYPESGRGWGLGRYWTPDGTISLEGGYVVGEDGVLHPRRGHRGAAAARVDHRARGAGRSVCAGPADRWRRRSPRAPRCGRR